MKKRLLLFAVLTSATFATQAQQDKALTHFVFDRTTVNPAATALTRNAICGTFIYRNQWDKINGAPNSGTFNVEADLDQYVPSLFGGIAFYQDLIGYNRQNVAILNIGYSLKNLLPVDLRVGVGLGMNNFSQNPAWLPPVTLVDPSLPAAFSSTKFDANFGIFLRHTLPSNGHEFNIGLSSTHLSAPTQDGISSTGSLIPVGYDVARHYYFMGGYKVTNIRAGDDLDFNVMLKTDVVKTSIDFNARYIYDSKYYGGLTFRSSDAVGVMVGVMPGPAFGIPALNNMTVGYSYDFTINKLSNISQGSHELLLKYCYPLPGIPLTITKHPRWL